MKMAMQNNAKANENKTAKWINQELLVDLTISCNE